VEKWERRLVGNGQDVKRQGLRREGGRKRLR
jgi:hypothetical protein